MAAAQQRPQSGQHPRQSTDGNRSHGPGVRGCRREVCGRAERSLGCSEYRAHRGQGGFQGRFMSSWGLPPSPRAFLDPATR